MRTQLAEEAVEIRESRSEIGSMFRKASSCVIKCLITTEARVGISEQITSDG